jgi:hypothetical protein
VWNRTIQASARRERQLARACRVDAESERQRAHRHSRLYASASWPRPVPLTSGIVSKDAVTFSGQSFSAGRVHRSDVPRQRERHFAVRNNRHDFKRPLWHSLEQRTARFQETVAEYKATPLLSKSRILVRVGYDDPAFVKGKCFRFARRILYPDNARLVGCRVFHHVEPVFFPMFLRKFELCA